MLGISYGELFLILGATAALIGPKDLPRIARTVGRLVGRSVGYIQMARGQFDNVMQQSQATQVHKELQETMAQLEAIRYEIRSISIMNPAPFTRRLDAAADPPPNTIAKNNDDDYGTSTDGMGNGQIKPTVNIHKGFTSADTVSSRLHSQATTYARLAEAPNVRSGLVENGNGGVNKFNDERDGLLAVLPVSAESAGFLPKRTEVEHEQQLPWKLIFSKLQKRAIINLDQPLHHRSGMKYKSGEDIVLRSGCRYPHRKNHAAILFEG